MIPAIALLDKDSDALDALETDDGAPDGAAIGVSVGTPLVELFVLDRL